MTRVHISTKILQTMKPADLPYGLFVAIVDCQGVIVSQVRNQRGDVVLLVGFGDHTVGNNSQLANGFHENSFVLRRQQLSRLRK